MEQSSDNIIKFRKAQEIFSRIGKAKYFSTLDATSGFLQVPLADESTSLTTMATPFGRYKFLWLPFGLSSSPEAYQQMMVYLFGDLPGVEVYFDDWGWVSMCGEKPSRNTTHD